MLKRFLNAIKHKRTRFLLSIVSITIAVFGLSLSLVQQDFFNKTTTVCDEKVITRYNQAITSTDNFTSALKAVAMVVEKTHNYDKDSTCVFIVYQHYAHIMDVDASRKQLEIMKSLAHKGGKIDDRIIDKKSLDTMEQYVKSLEYNRDLGGKGDGSG